MEYPVIREMFKGETPKSVFEVGCANGGLLHDVTQKGELVVGGLDQHESDLGRAKALFPTYARNFFVHDMNHVPWPIKDKEYDIAFTVGTLFYAEKPQVILQEMCRIACKVMIAEPSQDDTGTDHHGTRHHYDYQKILEEMGGKIEFLGLVAKKYIYKYTP